ncbi:MAG: hypothetical protein KAI24_19245 [Planctomycetes bacterium]|nr:hypothetical protein [Planctomycetota bacterium]
MFGELPDDDHIAYEVVQRALRGGREGQPEEPVSFRRRRRPRDEWPPSVRAMLFDEALEADGPTRDLARQAIACEVAYGGDVENPAFAARFGIPGYGTVGMHMLDLPRKLRIPPYEYQATRLFVRLDKVRGQVPKDPRWAEAQVDARLGFIESGELPEDPLHLEAMLVDVELDLLRKHRRGVEVGQAMELLYQLSHAAGDERRRLLGELSERAAKRELVR